jgi:hypothetical protein
MLKHNDEHWNDPSGSVKGEEYFYKLIRYQPLKKEFAT